MYYFGKTSQSRLATVHQDLQTIFNEAITDSPIDFGISSGFRTAEEQYEMYLKGASRLDGYVKISSHQLGLAVDLYAYVNGKASYDKRHLAVIAGHILGTAARLGYKLTWGADWDRDWDMDDQSLIDFPHFELFGDY